MPTQFPTDRAERAFTLVEIAVTIAVVAILLLAGVGLLGGNAAQARKSSTELLIGMIEQARTTAISTRSHVVLAMAEPGDLPHDEDRGQIGLFKVECWPENSNEPVNAEPMKRWRNLENGVVLSGGEVAGLENPMDHQKLRIQYTRGGQTQSIQVRALAFNPRGGLHHPSGSSQVVMRIAEGHYTDGIAKVIRRGDAQTIAENRLKIGRVTARPYRMD